MNRKFHPLPANYRPGLRIVKTGIAVTVCIVISNVLRLTHPLLAVIATVLSMGKSIDMSVRSGKNKMIGVLLGTALGGCFARLLPGNAGLCGLGVILALYLCQLLRLKGAGLLSSFAFAAVMFGSAQSAPWRYAGTCAENALLGIAVAVVINLIVMPPNYAEQIKRSFAILHERTAAAIEDAANRRRIDVNAVESVIESLARNIQLYVSEAKFLRGDDDEVFAISSRVSIYRMIVDELRAVETLELTEAAPPSDKIQTVYEYHMNRIRQLKKNVL
jgi:uncharacterized membrane protein YgaE (UPF0421/DUF939 family)